MSILSRATLRKATLLGRRLDPWQRTHRRVIDRKISGGSRWFHPEQIEIVEITLTLPRLSAGLRGTRFAQISDIHLCKLITPHDLQAVIQLVNRLSPEFLLVTGDFISGEEYADGLIDPFCRAEMPIYGILGNHDSGIQEWALLQALRETPVQLLRNRSVWLKDDLWLAGLDDACGGLPRLKHALVGVPSRATTLLMAHEPDIFQSVVASSAPIAAQFSGHTHGGQIRLPALRADLQGRYSWAPILPTLGRSFPMGLYTKNGRYLYTNRGIGFSGMPIRLNCPPEITLFTLA